VKRSDNILFLFWIGLSLLILYFSNQYGLGGFHHPGPGLMPFLLGLFLLIISFYLLVNSLLKRSRRDKTLEEGRSPINFKQLSLVLAALFFYGLLLEKLGYLIVTFLTLMVLFWGAGFKKWTSILIASSLTVLITFFLFTYLGVRFPPGVLRFIGIG